MRCIGFIKPLISYLTVILKIVGLFSSPTVLGDLAFANATPLIHRYLQSHPVNIKTLEHTQTLKLQELQHIPKNRLITKVKQLENKHVEIDQKYKQKEILALMYPVRSNLLSPGIVATRSVQIVFPQPIFIVGDDAFSKKWLQHYCERLVQLHAKGFVVNVMSFQAMQALQQAYPTLSLYPLPGNALAKWLQLTHYPVLISDHHIQQ